VFSFKYEETKQAEQPIIHLPALTLSVITFCFCPPFAEALYADTILSPAYELLTHGFRFWQAAFQHCYC